MSIPAEIFEGLKLGSVIPYLGPGMLDLIPGGTPVPSDPEGLAGVLTSRASVPHKIRKRLTASAQFIENFKHRKTLVGLMSDAYKTNVSPSAFHLQLASLALPLIVDTWYDDAMPGALARAVGDAPKGWGQVQGLSQSEHFGTWYGYYSSSGAAVPDYTPGQWKTLLYKPIGGHVPADNYLVSDTDYVEVLTEIDIQTPIPQDVQTLRVGRHFLFLGCRFNDQLTRSFARQIMKRSSDTHWAVLPDELTRTEARFITEQKIQRLPITLSEFATLLREQLQPEAA
jgi:SIR2-like protein